MLSLVRPPAICHGYAMGCLCPKCVARQEGVHSGVLFYNEAGRLVYRPMPQATDPVQAYVRDRRKVRAAA
jgi:hypothetical protein